ncbi:MAG: transporter substrate-binding domain-containing protein, partial [Psychrobacillus psychrotolerans]
MKKKLILSIITLIVMSIVAGCGFGGGKVLDRMEKDEVLNVAFEGTYPPFNYLDDDGELTGFDV